MANILVTPYTLALTLTAFALAVSVDRLVTLSTLALVLTTYVPSVAVGTIVTPGALALAFLTETDSYSEANQDGLSAIQETHPSADAVRRSAYGQSFTGDGKPIKSCRFYAKVLTGTPGRVIGRLYAHAGTFGTSSVPTGAVLDSSDPQAADGWGGALGLRELTGFSGYIMVSGTKYCIIMEAYDGTWDAGNRIQLGIDISSPTHGGNRIQYYNSAWSATDKDVCFRVNAGTPPTVSMPRVVTPPLLALLLKSYIPYVGLEGGTDGLPRTAYAVAVCSKVIKDSLSRRGTGY